MLERLIEATEYTRTRRDTLAEANLGIEKLRVLFRLAKDLHHVNMARYEHAKTCRSRKNSMLRVSPITEPRRMRFLADYHLRRRSGYETQAVFS